MDSSARSILIADDEPALLRLMGYILEKQGYELRTVADGQAALDEVARVRPDLVVLDIMMPKMDGYAVAERLRAEDSTRNLPIILLSAKAQEEDIARGREVGVDTFITKPFAPDEFLRTVHELLDDSPSTDND